MRHFLISNDPNYRAATQLEDGTLIAYPGVGGGLYDAQSPVVLSDFSDLSDRAGIVERTNLPDPILDRMAAKFSKTLSL